MKLPRLSPRYHLALLVLRVGIGLSFVAHGLPKLLGGPDLWHGVGQAVGVFGITFAPTFWGFMAAISETFGGLLLAVGLITRPALVMMGGVMTVALVMHIKRGDGYAAVSHPLELLVVFLAVFLAGPGRWSLDAVLARVFGKRGDADG